MKLRRRDALALVFELDRRECEVLGYLLRRYPVLDPQWHQIARPEHLGALKAEQEMLTEAMTAEQSSNRRRVAIFIKERLGGGGDDEAELTGDGSSGKGGGTRASRRIVRIPREEADWLLQVINDVRVGSWVRLGCPEEAAMHTPALAAKSITDYTAMEIGGLVQSLLLEALNPGRDLGDAPGAV